ncbi:MAG TPA: hypothetical protein PLV72_04385 [Candidatus Magasanikbacteria bacterium]|nr:hypothetical protein [Candidatus Magasanikbacteria bacterium]
MNISKLTRQEKEQLYIKKMTQLQLHWGNPIDSDWDFSDWTDEQLNKGLNDTIGQLKFELAAGAIGTFFKYAGLVFVTLGIIGLLIFGIKQIF